MKLMVKRDAGDRLAPDPVVDSLCNAQAPALSRGQNYLYENGFDKKFYNVNISFMGGACGDTIEVQDTSLGKIFKAKLNGWKIQASIKNDGIIIKQNIRIERSLIENGD